MRKRSFCIDIPLHETSIQDTSEEAPKNTSLDASQGYFYPPKKITVPNFRHLFRLKGNKNDIFSALDKMAQEKQEKEKQKNKNKSTILQK